MLRPFVLLHRMLRITSCIVTNIEIPEFHAGEYPEHCARKSFCPPGDQRSDPWKRFARTFRRNFVTGLERVRLRGERWPRRCRDAGKGAEAAAIAAHAIDHRKEEKNTSDGPGRSKDDCRASSLVFLSLYRDVTDDGDLAFKLAPHHRNLIERETDSVSSCAITLDWDFNVGERRQHRSLPLEGWEIPPRTDDRYDAI